MSQNILEARGLHKSFGATRALAGINLAVRPGESLAIMGASGSGKTTLLHCLAGITVPDSGEVHFRSGAGQPHPIAPSVVSALGETERSRLRRESFGFVFQQGLLIPELTALENVALALMITGVKRAEAERRGAEWLAALGLTGMEGRRIGQLSGGQAQRVAIARAQVTGASVVFADEPTGALDSQTSREVMDALLWSTTGQGRTLVLVTHDIQVAARCSRTVHVRDGVIIAEHEQTTEQATEQAGAPETVQAPASASAQVSA